MIRVATVGVIIVSGRLASPIRGTVKVTAKARASVIP
jgi:hypothetical protein